MFLTVNGVILLAGERLRRRAEAATPVMLAAGLLKLASLACPAGAGIGGQVIVGSLVGAVAAYPSVRLLTRYFTSRTTRTHRDKPPPSPIRHLQ